MSLVVGLEQENKVYIATDSRISAVGNSFAREIPHAKLFVSPCQKFLIGYVGFIRDIQVLANCWSNEKEEVTIEQLPDFFRCALMNHGRVKDSSVDEDTMELMHSTFLIATKGHLFELNSDFGVVQVADPFNAIGSGREMAIAIMKATENLINDPVERLKLTMDTVASYCPGVGGEIYWDVIE